MKRLDVIKMVRDYGVQVRLVSLYGQCRGLCRKYKDGYLILIEESLSDEQKLKTFSHELLHIKLGHLDNDILTTEEKEQEVLQHLS